MFACSINLWLFFFFKLQGRPCLTGSSKNPCGLRQMKVVWTFKAFKIEMIELMVSDVSKNVDFD